MSVYSPPPWSVRGRAAQAPGAPDHEVCSLIVGTNADLIREVCALWVRDSDVIADLTYGEGAFWRWNPERPAFRFDIKTGTDSRHTPLPDRSVDVVVIDPPYRPAHGSAPRETRGEMFDRYGLGGVDTMTDVLALYADLLTEARRVLRAGGRVLVKCQDMAYQSRLHLVSYDVLTLIRGSGLDLLDQFVLGNTTRIRQRGTQRLARRSHSVLWVASTQ